MLNLQLKAILCLEDGVKSLAGVVAIEDVVGVVGGVVVAFVVGVVVNSPDVFLTSFLVNPVVNLLER